MNTADARTPPTHGQNKNDSQKETGKATATQGGAPETDTRRASPHALPIAPTSANGSGHPLEAILWVLDGLSRRTLIPLPPSAERPSETPLFDSTPPADAAMAVARSAVRPSTARLCDTARRTPARYAANWILVRRRASVCAAMCGGGSHLIEAMVGAVVSASFQRF